MKTEELIEVLRQHPGKDVFVHTAWDDCWTAKVLGTTEYGVFLGAGEDHANLPEPGDFDEGQPREGRS